MIPRSPAPGQVTHSCSSSNNNTQKVVGSRATRLVEVLKVIGGGYPRL